MDNVIKPCRHGLMVFNRHDAYIGRSLDVYGEFSPGEVALFEQVVRAGDTVIEVGANIGAHTVRLAQLAGRRGAVHAFEPQRVVFQALCANLALNSIANTHAYPQAVGAAEGTLRVPPVDYGRPGNFGGIELGPEAPRPAEGGGAAEAGAGAGAEAEAVPLVTLDRLFARLEQLRLLKVDVEGMELDVLLGARELIGRTRPLLYVENDRAGKAEALVAHLRSLGYDLYWHTPPFYIADNYRQNPEDVFGDTISFNVLAVPSGSAMRVEGFRPVEAAVHPVLRRDGAAGGLT
jgi:FkbM family methyltransferase